MKMKKIGKGTKELVVYGKGDSKKNMNEAPKKQGEEYLKNYGKDIENTGEIHSEIREGIKKGLKSVKEELEVNQELREGLVKEIVKKKIIEENEKNYNKSSIDIFLEMIDFLKIQTSRITDRNYRKSITDLFTWCLEEKIDPVKITRREAESYMVYLCNKYANNSVRTHILSICSFYHFIIHRYPSIISVNSFSKLKLPKIIPSRRIDRITMSDLTELKKELKRIGRKDILCAVDLMMEYGFRIGIFENMKIDSNGNWNSVSKEHAMKGKFLKSEVRMINETGILGMKRYTITNTIVKYTKKLFQEGKIGSPFSPHDIRHWYITTKGKGLTMEEFIKFSRGIHKNVNTTLNYMNI
jgi:site-specific recombinase XerD